ncbi:MAG TPA: TolC family protein [Candidatus Cloacimonadota bacterium]|jgi:outer membrane protein TolC|nr:TolC family protein [Candidatus Cloacimonadota bacterium]HOQ80072.1 TolC family protein [Candidatus Cloacimonadota bacterium]HPY97081.1 TolC family protein [Candidatus Cloacimonadota bacterium]HQB41113.1 TolC family protein [Candidatus Cloacimonadota bacterium]
MKKTIKALIVLLPIFSLFGALNAEGLSIQEARKMAKENNISNRSQVEMLKSAQSRSKASFTQFLPSVSAAGTYIQRGDDFQLKTDMVTLPVYKIDSSTGTPAPVAGEFVPFQIDMKLGEKDSYLFNVNLTQPLFTGGKVLTQYKLNKNLEMIEQNKMQLSDEDLILKVDEAYWRVVTLQEKVLLAEQFKSTVENHLTDLRNYKAVGIITQNDVLKAEVKLNDAELNLLKANNGLKLARMAFNQVIGQSLDSELTLSDKLEEGVLNTGKADLDSIAEKRPELQMLNTAIKLAECNTSLQISRYMPNIVLNASYNFMNPNPYNSFKDECGKDWTIALLAQMEIFHWNERGYMLSSAKSMQKAAQYQFDDASQLINLEILQSENSLNESQQKVALTKISVQQTEENLTYCNDKFRQGILKSTDVLDAQTLWQKAESDYLDALAELKISEIKFNKAIGELTQK